MAIDQIEAGLSASENFLVQLDQLIKTQILASWPDKIPGVDAIARGLDGLVAQAETRLKNAEQLIKSQIDPLIRNAIPNALDFIGALTKTLDTHLTQLISNIATTEDVLGATIKTIQAHAPHLAQWIYTNVAGSFGNVALGVLKEMEGQDGAGINAVLDTILGLPNKPKYLETLVHGFRHRGAEWQALALPALLVGAILGAVAAIEEPFHVGIRQQAYGADPVKELEVPDILTAHLRGYLPDHAYDAAMRQQGYVESRSLIMLRNREMLLDPETATRAYLRGDLDQAHWEMVLSQHGMSTETSRTFWRAALTPLTETDAREAFLRGLRTEQEHDAILAKLGYESESAKLRRSLYFYIPPAQDLIHMAIRNVFNPEIVERFQLFGDFPAPFAQAAHQQGISDEWARRYWGAHWIVPGNEEAFAMFQRTTDNPLDENADRITLSDGTVVHNIIGGSTLKLLLREKDIAPFYRDKLTQLAYRPLTRIDVRRMASVGILSQAGVERAYLDLGYSQAHARQLAAFTLELAKRAKKDEVASLTDNLRKRVLALWIAGKMDDDAAKTTLGDLGATDAEVEAWFAEALLVQRSDRTTQIENGIGKLYIAGFIDAKEAEKRLADHDIPTAAITQMFGQWDLQIEFAGGKEHIHKHRELTKGEVVEAFLAGMISENDAKQHLATLGYDAPSSEAEIGLALFKQARQARTAQIDAIRAAYTNGVIEELDASNRLDALTVAGAQRDAYIEEWTLQRESRTERIPIATLRDMVLAGFMEDSSALSHLRRHRFTDADAQLLLNFWHNRQQTRRTPNA